VNAAITATCIAPVSVRGSAAASRNSGRRLGISAAVAVRGVTPPGNAGGESDNGKSQK
jgi:hypothetical protein